MTREASPEAVPEPSANHAPESWRKAPPEPGVYLMKDAAGRIIYVGKAKNLKARLRSYFSGADERPQIRFLMQHLAAIEFVRTTSESEALLLEDNLIKQHRPRYNVMLRDDKTYLCIRIDLRKDYPRIEWTRRIDDPGALYFGPYPSVAGIREAMATLSRIFPLRHCSDAGFASRKRPCLYHAMGLCLAPCVNRDRKTKSAYRRIIGKIVLFLKGDDKRIAGYLEEEMHAAAQREDFERAALLRDVIFDRRGQMERQGITSARLRDCDVIGSFQTDTVTVIAMLFVRSGRLLHKKEHVLTPGPSYDETLAQFLLGYYHPDRVVLPSEIVVEQEVEGQGALAGIIGERYGRPVRIVTAADPETMRLVKTAAINASHHSFAGERGLEQLRLALHLPELPERIECFDVAHFGGKDTTCAMAVMVRGALAKGEYRLFNIDGTGNDDYGNLYQAFRRRLEHPEWPLPRIMVADGGRGQLAVLARALDDAGVTDVFPVAIAKDGGTPLFIRGRRNALVLPPGHEGLRLLQKLREDTHRFANVQLRRREKKRTVPARKKAPGDAGGL